MKACIVSCFDWYEKRLKYVKSVFEDMGASVDIITSDFDHTRKDYVKPNKDLLYIHTLSYKKNLSLRRIYSHIKFARDVRKKIEAFKPNYIYILIPPNMVLKQIAKYCKKHIDVKIYLDVIDMWPESMPLNPKRAIMRIPYNIWKNIRDNNLSCADYIFTECSLYQEKLRDNKNKFRMRTLHLVKEHNIKYNYCHDIREEVVFAYLGTINNIIDIDKIVELLKLVALKRKTLVRIIGTGEKKEYFIQCLENVGVMVIDEGVIYDENAKTKILQQCDYGLNIMKESVYVGLTTKSIDYMSVGLPLINNIKGDTECIVEKNNIGYNISNDNLSDVAQKIIILSREEMQKMHMRAYELYDDLFTPDVFIDKLKESIQD